MKRFAPLALSGLMIASLMLASCGKPEVKPEVAPVVVDTTPPQPPHFD